MRSILVPLDGSALAECALAYAQALARATGASLLLVRVVPEPGPEGDAAAAISTEIAGRYLAAIRSSTAPEAFETIVERGPTAEVILALARTRAVDLIAMTAHGDGAAGRAVGGPVARAVLAASPAPVLFARAEHVEVQRPSAGDRVRLLVPLDGSRRAEAALPVALGLAEQLGGELVLLSAVRPQGAPGDPDEDAEERALAAEAWAYLYGERHRLADQEHGPAPVVDVRIAPPVEAVVEACRDHRADFVVMATHGRLEADQPLIGSVAAGLLLHSDAPLILVPLSAGEAAPSH